MKKLFTTLSLALAVVFASAQVYTNKVSVEDPSYKLDTLAIYKAENGYDIYVRITHGAEVIKFKNHYILTQRDKELKGFTVLTHETENSITYEAIANYDYTVMYEIDNEYNRVMGLNNVYGFVAIYNYSGIGIHYNNDKYDLTLLFM